MNKLYHALGTFNSVMYNGGNYFDLVGNALSSITETDLIIWMADVDNTKEKIYPVKNTGSVLICSKVIRDGYTYKDAIARIFKMHGNAVIAITKDSKTNMFVFEFWDALANCWYSGSDIEKLALTIYRFYIFSKGSIRRQTARDTSLIKYNDGRPDDLNDFIKLNNSLADFIQTSCGDRFFGNLTTRCQKLFPSERDGLIAKQSYLESNKEKVKKLISALLYANDKMNSDEASVKTAAKAFAKAYGTNEKFAIDGSKNIHYITLGDAQNFFGLNSSYTGMQGDELYSKMARTYEKLGLCKKPLAWRKVSYPDIIEELAKNASEVKGDQAAETNVKFKETSTSDAETKVAISDKKVTIEYPVDSDILDNNAQSIIDREFAGIAKQFAGAKIRIVGNTDNTGNYAYNVELSRRRAQSVANYLVNEYGFDKNRFIIVGNGPKRAVEDKVVGSNNAYRTTDFQLVTE